MGDHAHRYIATAYPIFVRYNTKLRHTVVTHRLNAADTILRLFEGVVGAKIKAAAFSRYEDRKHSHGPRPSLVL